MLVRPFEDYQLEALIGMYEDLDSGSRTMGLPPRSEQGIREWLEQLTRDGWNLVGLAEEMIVGHVGVAPASASEPHFVIFVRPAFQNRGLGTELVKQLVAYAEDRGYEGLILSVSKANREAISVYKNVGFKLNNDTLLRPDQQMEIDMRLSLSEPIAQQVQLPPAER